MQERYTTSGRIPTVCGGLLLGLLLIGPQVTAAQGEIDSFKKRYLYEPECEDVGGRLGVVDDTQASSDQYLSPAAAFFPDSAPGNDPADYVSMHFEPYPSHRVPEDYRPYFRIRQAGGGGVSLWLRTNGGSWELHTYTTANAEVGEGGWIWVPNVAESESGNGLGLTGEGLKTLDVAFARSDQQLDEVYLEEVGLYPDEYFLRPFSGNFAGTNCPDFFNAPPVAILDPGEEVFMTFDPEYISADQSYDPDGTIVQYYIEPLDDPYDPAEPYINYTAYESGILKFTATVYDFYGASDTDSTLWQFFPRIVDESSRPRFRLNLECAQVGDYWTLHENPNNGTPSVIVGGPGASTDRVPEGVPENQVTFVLPDIPEIPEPDDYDDWYPYHYLTGSFTFPMDKGNCLWVNFNDTGWQKWEVISSSSFGPQVILQPGDNILQLAYCSPGLQIDYLGLRPDTWYTEIAFPTHHRPDPIVIGCDSVSSPPMPEYWLEAECALVGGRWQVVSSDDASQGLYVVANGINAYDGVFHDEPENYLRFLATVPETGTFQLQARINAPTNLDDSYYVRVNDGPWYPWTSGIRQGTGFQWNLLPGGGVQLDKGVNFIDFAFREDGTQLDKIYLGLSTRPIAGRGQTAQECSATVTERVAFWLEAECADYGSAWTLSGEDLASNQAYLVALGDNALVSPPAAVPGNLIKFTLDWHNLSPGLPLYLFGRIDAATADDDSYWVRFNGGEWYAWKTIKDGPQGFQWNRLPIPLIGSTVFDNVIEIAYRENGARLDGIYLSSVDSLPEDPFGYDPPCNPFDVTLEAECGLAGGGWRPLTSFQTAQNQFMSFAGERHLGPPVADEAKQELVYDVRLAVAGTYHLFLRLKAPDPGRNSVWVQVDDGEWIKMWEEIGGAQLLTSGFEWRKVNQDGTDISFQLEAGMHTIHLANREPGTAVDQLHLSLSPGVPDEILLPTVACLQSAAGVAARSAGAVEWISQPEAFRLDVYPNPVLHELTLELSSPYSGPVAVVVYDTQGRRVRTVNYVKEKENSLLRAGLDVTDLPPGVYRIQVIEGDRKTIRPFIRM